MSHFEYIPSFVLFFLSFIRFYLFSFGFVLFGSYKGFRLHWHEYAISLLYLCCCFSFFCYFFCQMIVPTNMQIETHFLFLIWYFPLILSKFGPVLWLEWWVTVTCTLNFRLEIIVTCFDDLYREKMTDEQEQTWWIVLHKHNIDNYHQNIRISWKENVVENLFGDFLQISVIERHKIPYYV